jgi:DNA polymerase-3 subunit gamma/tau
VFVLATTDPQRVIPTIRSRTQHFEFRLLSGTALADLVRHVQDDAGLDLPSEAIDLAVRRGNGSARDALSVLDQISAAGAVDDDVAVLDELVQAISERDAGRALVAVAEACSAGWDVQRLAADLVEHLRWGFLATMAPKLVPLTDEARERIDEQGRRLGPAALVRSVEVVGQALVDMRDALDPRATFEVALVRLARPDADHSPEALLERIEGLERRLSSRGPSTPAAGGNPVPQAQPTPQPQAQPTPQPQAQPTPPESGASSPASPRDPADPGGRAALGAIRRQGRAPASAPEPAPVPGSAPAGAPAPGAASPPVPTPAPEPAGRHPDRDELVKAWGDSVLASLKGRPRARFRAGRFVAAEGGFATFALPDEIHRSYSEECRVDVEAALKAHFGVPIRLRLVVDDESADSPSVPASQSVADDPPDPDELTDAPPGSTSVEARLLQTFPGAEEVPGMTAPPGPDR